MDNTPANQYALVTLLVKTAALGNFTGPGTANPDLPGSMMEVSGFLADGQVNGETVNLTPYFNGALKSTNRNGMATSVNFLDGGSEYNLKVRPCPAPLTALDPMDLINMPMSVGAAGSNQAMLLNHLYQYFGVLLGCSGYGEDGFSEYQGSNNQYNVHKYMDISANEFNYFIQMVGASATSFGASDSDVTMVANSLNMSFGQRCAPKVAVVPDTDPEYQQMCIGDGCPLASNAVAGCSGQAAVPGFTAMEPVSVASGMMSATMGGSGGMGGAMTSMPAQTSMPAFSGSGNYAPKQTAAAGLMAGAAGVAALLL